MSAKFNPSNLKVARSARKLSINEVAEFTKISADRLDKFERGEAIASVGQLQRLSELYNVRFLDFFSDKELAVEPVIPDFRKPNAPSADLSPGGLQRLWRVESASSFAGELIPYLRIQNLKSREFERLSNRNWPSGDQLRHVFEEWSSTRIRKLKFSGTDVQVKFRLLRQFMEFHGCLTMVAAAPSEDYLGFYKKFTKNVNTAFVNSKIQNEKRQLFTLAHEFAHFIVDREGISDPFSASANETEKLSNEFAASFLAPENEINQLISKLSLNTIADKDRLVSYISNNTLLSLQASALRLRELDIITKSDTQRFFGKNRKSIEDKEGKSTAQESRPMGRSVSVGRKLSEVGVFTAYVASQALDKHLIESVDVVRALNISENLQPDIFDLAKRRFEASAQ